MAASIETHKEIDQAEDEDCADLLFAAHASNEDNENSRAEAGERHGQSAELEPGLDHRTVKKV